MLLIALSAERLHERRVNQLSRLAFGANREMSWFALAWPFIRASALAMLAWGMLALLLLPPKARLRNPDAAENIDPKLLKRVMLVLDVSPSMQIKDAAGGTLTRSQRGVQVLKNMISRLDFEKSRITIAPFYTGVKAVVIDAVDPDVIDKVIANNSFDQAFEDGPTDLGVAIRGAYKLAENWLPDSTTMVIVTDGDSSPVGDLPPKPPSINRALLLGVGDIDQGTFIDNHISRQNAMELNGLAGQVGGIYADADGKYVPTDLLRDLHGMIHGLPPDETSLREYALVVILIGAVALVGWPLVLARFGTRSKAGVRAAENPHRLMGALR